MADKQRQKEKKDWRKMVIVIPKLVLLLGIISGIVLLVRGILGTSLLKIPSYYWGCGLLVATAIFFRLCLRRIPARPPYIGLVVIWGKRLPIVIPEGWHILAPFFPFLYTVTMIRVEKTNIDLTFSDIRCKARIEDQEEGQKTPFAGGEISVNISYTYYPDYKIPLDDKTPDDKTPDDKTPEDKASKIGKRLIAFINSGGHEGVQKIVRDLIEEDIRQMAKDESWEEITFAGDKIRNQLVKKLTGEELGDEEKLAELGKNGFPDIAGLGIRICRFNVGKVKEQGELAKAAETFAKELQERRGENEEMEFIFEWVKKFKKLDGITGDVALDVLQVERGKATRHIQQFRGLEGAAKIGGALVGKLLKEDERGKKDKRSEGGEKSKKDKRSKENKKSEDE